MSSKSSLSYGLRAQHHPNALVRRLFKIAESKQTNIVLSADLTNTNDLLRLADQLGPYLAVLKTHIDIIEDFSQKTIDGLLELSQKHDFLIFEDRKFVDIGNTVQKQYRGGALKIYDWAHIINLTVLPGPGIVQALDQIIQDGGRNDRGILILAEMTSKGSLATGLYTKASVDFARLYPKSVVGFVTTRELSEIADQGSEREDFVVFTTGVNIASKGDALGQQYQTPTSAMQGGSDFLIAGRGIYAATDPIAAILEYRNAGWNAYQKRLG